MDEKQGQRLEPCQLMWRTDVEQRSHVHGRGGTADPPSGTKARGAREREAGAGWGWGDCRSGWARDEAASGGCRAGSAGRSGKRDVVLSTTNSPSSFRPTDTQWAMSSPREPNSDPATRENKPRCCAQAKIIKIRDRSVRGLVDMRPIRRRL